MMGKQTQTDRKWRLHLFFLRVTLFCMISCAAKIHESSPTLERKRTGVTLSPLKVTGVRSASPFRHLRPPLVQHHVQADEARPQSDIASLSDVSLTCARSDFVLRVNPAFYGLGADASELTLGLTCKVNVTEPHGDLLFQYPLTACDSDLKLMPGYLSYKFVLHYDPSPQRFPGLAQSVTVGIECRYPRNYHIHQLAVQPTWESHTLHKTLKTSQSIFQIQLMDNAWENPVQSPVFHLGQTVNVQVSALHITPGQKLYINSCYATPVTHPKSHITFTIINNYGCLLDSKTESGAAKFVSRTHKSVRFSMKAFQFVTNPDAEISMHCQLHVTSAGPSPAHKSCTYSLHSWEALTGDDAICECCESQCESSKRHRAMMDGVISSGSLLVSSHSGSLNSTGNTHKHKTHKATVKAHNPKLMHPGEVKTVKQKETFGATDLKSVKEVLKWSSHENEKVKGKGDMFDLKLQNDTGEWEEGQRLKSDVLKEEVAEFLVTDRNVKAEIEEVFDMEISGDDDLDVKTWYFAWN